MTKDERFESLYRKYYRRIVKFYVTVFRLSEPDAEDLTQQVFLQFFNALDEYRGDAEWAYLEEIARNVGLNRIRSQGAGKRRGQNVDIDDLKHNHEPAAPAGPDYAEREQEALRKASLRTAIDELPAGQREVTKLWLEERRYDEIAIALRITVDAVKSRLRDAKKVLRAKLGDETAFPEEEP